MHPLVTSDLIHSNLPHNAAAPSVIDARRTFTYGELARECDAWASWLWVLGIRRGDRVGIHLPKSPEEIFLTFAVARIGAIIVNINFLLKPFQVRHIVEDAGISLFICDHARLPGLIQDGLLHRVKLVIQNGGESLDARVLSFSRRPNLPGFTGPDPIDLDIAALLYTSGSTGRPKGVMFTHGNILAGARAVANYLILNREDRILSLLPLSFDYGLNQVLTAFLAGGAVVLQTVAMASEIVRTVQAQSVTGLALVPPTWIDLTSYLIETGKRLPSLRYITNSGGRIPLPTLKDMSVAFAKTDIYLMYGLTEGFRATYLDPNLFATKMGAIGRAIPGNEVFVIHSEKGLCGPHEHGELVQRGPLITMGYWKHPSETDSKIRPNRFLRHLIGDEKVLHSGDTVYADEDGVLWFVGRSDGMIKSSGYRISPEEIEELVVESGLVKEVIAFGVPDAVLGEAIDLAVIWDSGANAEALTRWCRKEMPSYMVPKTIHTWTGELPRTSSGKYDRPSIAQRFAGSEASCDRIS